VDNEIGLLPGDDGPQDLLRGSVGLITWVKVGVGKLQQSQWPGPRGGEEQFAVIGGLLSEQQVTEPLFGADVSNSATGEESRGTGSDTLKEFAALHGMVL